jgi:hypothetical protein
VREKVERNLLPKIPLVETKRNSSISFATHFSADIFALEFHGKLVISKINIFLLPATLVYLLFKHYDSRYFKHLVYINIFKKRIKINNAV